MTSPTSSVPAAPRPLERSQVDRRILVVLGLACLVLLLVWKPPFVVRPLAGRTVPGSQPAQTAAAKFVEPIWSSKVLPTIQEKAQDMAKILPEIRADPNAAGQKYGRREATNPYNYMIKGTGKVTEMHTESQAGTAIVEVPGLTEKIALQIGPVVRGTALRDATGVVSFNQFTNQLAFADVSKEMNSRALKSALGGTDPASLAGKTVKFWGAFTFDPHLKSPVLVTPVKIEL
jgi:predicted lipoprotein